MTPEGIVPLTALPPALAPFATGERVPFISIAGHHAPGLAKYLAAYDAALQAPVTVSPALMGLLRERVRAALDPASARPGEAEGAPDPATGAALAWAELMVANHYAVDEAVMAEVRRHFTDRQVVEIGGALVVFHVLERLALALGVPAP